MITTIFLNLLYYILSIVFYIFPTSSGFPPEVITSFEQLGGYTAIINTLIPLSTLSTVLILIITFELLIFAFKGLRFIIGYIPFIGGKG